MFHEFLWMSAYKLVKLDLKSWVLFNGKEYDSNPQKSKPNAFIEKYQRKVIGILLTLYCLQKAAGG